MKFKTVLLKVPAALLVASVLLTPVGLPPRAEAGPQKAFRAPGCSSVMPSIPAIARSIFGPYAWSGGGSSNVPGTGALQALVPDGSYNVDCLFARKLDSSGSIPTDSDLLVTGYVQLSNSAAVLQTWSRLASRYGMITVNALPYHYTESWGMSIGYRDGLNEIAYAFWKDGDGRLHNIPGSNLRPLVYANVCASC